MNRSMEAKRAKEAREQAENDKFAQMAADADAQPKVRKKTPRVFRNGEETIGQTACVGSLKGKDLERLQKQLGDRFKK